MTTDELKKYFGGIAGVCRVFCIHRSAFYQWGDRVPDSRQYEAEVKSGGALKSDYTLALIKHGGSTDERSMSHDGQQNSDSPISSTDSSHV